MSPVTLLIAGFVASGFRRFCCVWDSAGSVFRRFCCVWDSAGSVAWSKNARALSYVLVGVNPTQVMFDHSSALRFSGGQLSAHTGFNNVYDAFKPGHIWFRYLPFPVNVFYKKRRTMCHGMMNTPKLKIEMLRCSYGWA